MRMVIEREAGALRLEFGEASGAQPVAVAESVSLLHDPAGRLLAIELRGVDPAALQDVTFDLGGTAERPSSASAQPKEAGPAAAAAAPQPPSPQPIAPQPATAAERPPSPPAAPTPYTGPLSWDPDAEAAMLQVPFFSRGPYRIAACAMARRRGLDRVTAEVVRTVKSGR